MSEHIPFGKPLELWHEIDHFRASMFYAECASANEGSMELIEDAMADGEPEALDGNDATPDAMEFHRDLMHHNRWWTAFHLRVAEYLARQ